MYISADLSPRPAPFPPSRGDARGCGPQPEAAAAPG